MKIGINIYDLQTAQNGGIAWYIRSLISLFPKISPKDRFYLVGKKNSLNEVPANGFTRVTISEHLNRSFLSIKLREIIDEKKLDVWFSPLLVLDPPFCPIPSATTIPDMQHEYYPYFFSQELLHWRRTNYQLSADNADLIFTLSENSRYDIIRFLDVKPEKVKTIHIDSSLHLKNHYSEAYITKVKQKYNLPQKYLFYPANTWPHKNHLRLIEAFSRIKNQTDANLIFTGYPHQATGQILNSIRKNHLKNRVAFLGYIKEEDLPAIYLCSLGLVFPSLFEGFGIPLVEAFKTKTPVLCCCNPGLHEVAGNAALYFDGLSIKSIAEAILRFLQDEKIRQNLIERGTVRAKLFSYTNTAKQTLAYLKEIGKLGKNRQINKSKWPRISIVTPSFNQGKYIEKTIKSVLDQHYPNLEYIIVDGGSTDKTLNIIRKYEDKLTWISEKDQGQADAINKGLKMSTGEIIGYLNSDDTYEPDSLKKIASFFIHNPFARFVYGRGKHINKNDKYLEDYPSVPTDYTGLHPTCSVCQPTAFWRREILRDIGYFDATLKYAMDYDYWIRIAKLYPLNFIYDYLGNTRFYQETKTVGQKVQVHREIIEVQKKHYEKVHANWILAYVHAKLSKNNRATITKNTVFLVSLIIGSFFGFLKFSHRLPPRRVWKYYLIWTKEIFAFIYRKKVKRYFKK